MRVRRRLISQLADNLLRETAGVVNVKGAVDPRVIAKAHNIEIREAPFSENLSGFLIHDGPSVFIGVNLNDSDKRKKFTIAHELGHYFLHDRSEPFLDDSTGRFNVIPRNEVSKEGTDIREIEANFFAAELLMPESRLRADLEREGSFDLLDEDVERSIILRLAADYEVSVKALTIRLERLGFFTHV